MSRSCVAVVVHRGQVGVVALSRNQEGRVGGYHSRGRLMFHDPPDSRRVRFGISLCFLRSIA